MKIRPVTDKDLAAIARLRRQTIRHVNNHDYPKDVIKTWSADVKAQDLRKSADTCRRWIALDGEKIIGFCEHDFKEISRIYVHKDYLRKGVGSRLLAVAEDSLKQLGRKEIHIESTVTAKEFYERNGYKVIKMFMYKDMENVPVYKMVKQLTDSSSSDLHCTSK